MNLSWREYGQGPPLLILHGLFGSAANWGNVARMLASEYRVLLPELRNHGASPHADSMDYADLAGDVLEFLQQQGLEDAALLGHSMGGKVAMTLALTHAPKVRSLVVVDIAPVAYDHDFRPLIEAMAGLDLARIRSRADADHALEPLISDASLRSFLLQNLTYGNGAYRWRINLPVLEREMPSILGFPDSPRLRAYDGPALFVYGERSDYVQPAHHDRITKWFPQARLVEVAGAGHWLHVEQAEVFVDRVRSFLADE